VIFAIRTHRVPFFRSRASKPLTIATLACVVVGALLPFSPLADVLGFRALPAGFFAFLIGAIVVYLAIVELGKRRFDRGAEEGQPLAQRHPKQRIHHRASRWSIPGRVRTTVVH
jgi:Mg2+-importing ATPase